MAKEKYLARARIAAGRQWRSGLRTRAHVRCDFRRSRVVPGLDDNLLSRPFFRYFIFFLLGKHDLDFGSGRSALKIFSNGAEVEFPVALYELRRIIDLVDDARQLDLGVYLEVESR